MLLLAAGVIGGVVFLVTPDRVNNEEVAVEEDSSDSSMDSELTLKSMAFENGGTIPSKYTCDAENISPPLSISGVPEGTISLALIMDDPDIPKQFKEERGIDSFDHWTVYGISPDTTDVSEGLEPKGAAGKNGRSETGYTGPCPPPEYEPTEHRYFFRLYALDVESINPGSKQELFQLIEQHKIAETELMAPYKRK